MEHGGQGTEHLLDGDLAVGEVDGGDSWQAERCLE